MRNLLTTTAVLEGATGLAILSLPSAVPALILGSPPDTAVALALARIAGMALVALGVACWLARSDERAPSARGLVVAMGLYNAGVGAVLVYEAVGVRIGGLALWPTVVVHAAMGLWCVKVYRE